MAEEHETPYGGELPDVQDEAAASPPWLPGLGFAILCVLALFLAVRAATAHDDADVGDDGIETTAEAVEPTEAPAADAPSAAEGPQ